MTLSLKRRRRHNPAPAPAPAPPSPTSADDHPLEIVIIRSARRTKTVSARLRDWCTLEVRAPAKIDDDELDHIVQKLRERALAQRQKWRNFSSDEDLERRAQDLNRRYFQGSLHWRSVRFVGNQNARFGGCTPGRGTIRISDRLAKVPEFVLDYVLVHELAHLVERNHSKAFWDLVYRYPKTERARGYLMAMDLEDDMVDPAAS